MNIVEQQGSLRSRQQCRVFSSVKLANSLTNTIFDPHFLLISIFIHLVILVRTTIILIFKNRTSFTIVEYKCIYIT